MKINACKRTAILILAALMLTGMLFTDRVPAAAASAQAAAAAGSSDYADYLAAHPAGLAAQSYTLPVGEYNDAQPQSAFTVIPSYESRENVLLCESEAQRLDYSVTVAESGFYTLGVTFYPLTDDGTHEDIAVQINGDYPFSQARSLYLNYQYTAESDTPYTNDGGDEYAPRRVIQRDWTECLLTNPDHNFDGPLLFYLEQGVNTVSMLFLGESNLVLGDVTVGAAEQPVSYAEYIGGNSLSAGDMCIYTEAENISLQSDSTVIPVSEQSDPLCSPRSVRTLKINTVGTTWAAHGQWLEWEIEAEQSGWYQLSVRYKQNSLKGIAVRRSLSIDGKVPFAEAAVLAFPYTSVWKLQTVSDEAGNPYYFYLEEGKHTVRLEAVLGDLAEVIREIDDTIYEMNSAYRSVIMITSSSADKYRDYQIETEIPDLVDQITRCADRLEECNKRVEQMANGSSADSAILVTTAAQLRSMAEDPETIPYRLSSWESNIGSISSWTLSIREQPLQMDYFIFSGGDYKLPRAKANLIEKIGHSLKRFFVSFVRDYSDLGAGADKDRTDLTVWIGTGRDQAEVLWQMTDELFTAETGIGVSVKLVSATMIEAFLSGQAPDLSVQAARDIPVNLAVRGALLDLSAFEGFDEVTGWFADGALTPYTFQNCVYGLPDSQNFNMLFYRTDVFEELGLTVPQTWDEFINVANQLHLKQLDTGIPVDTDVSIYYTMLLQNGGEVFTEDYRTTLLDTQVSINAFTDWTCLFTETGLPLSYNLFNRFRSGEMPMVIGSYVNYNQLMSAAPEIRNLWQMTRIPGTVDENGEICRKESAGGTAAVILSSTTHPQEAWSFIKWWVADTAQIRYAQDIESRVGTLGRVASANTRALERQDYSPEMLEQLMLQRTELVEIPQVPGNYYLDRDLLNAFRDVIYNDRNAKESILDYSTRINNEIQRKRKELGIE